MNFLIQHLQLSILEDACPLMNLTINQHLGPGLFGLIYQTFLKCLMVKFLKVLQNVKPNNKSWRPFTLFRTSFISYEILLRGDCYFSALLFYLDLCLILKGGHTENMFNFDIMTKQICDCL